MPYYNCPFLLQCLNVLKINTAEVQNGTRDAKNTKAAPCPQHGPSQDFKSNELDSAFSQRQRQRKATFSPYRCFRSFVGSVTTAEEETLDTTAASWIIRVTEFFKGKKWFNYFLIFPLVKRVFSFVPSGQGLHNSSVQDKLLLIVYPEDQKQNSGTTTQIYNAQTARYVLSERWPNGTVTYVTGN